MKKLLIGLLALGSLSSYANKISNNTHFSDLEIGTVIKFNGFLPSGFIYNNGQRHLGDNYIPLPIQSVCYVNGDTIITGTALHVKEKSNKELFLEGITPYNAKRELRIHCTKGSINSLIYNTGVNLEFIDEASFDYNDYLRI